MADALAFINMHCVSRKGLPPLLMLRGFWHSFANLGFFDCDSFLN